MFKTAATKIAHNSTLPSLAGNKDLRPLQDLITAEKAVLVSLQKLSVDFNKASEALRTWGAGEGEDLGDTLSASTTILAHFSSALSQYATHEHAVRDEMKNVRSREEALDELKRRRKSLVAKADNAEKKLNKMSSEHKNLPSQTDILNRLKDEIRVMDTEIMAEEASLGDFKRQTTRAFMTLKFGGLLECCEKGSIAGEFGKLVISEIPVDTTQPGLPRSMYGGHAKTEELMADAQRRVGEVAFSSLPHPPDESGQPKVPPQGQYIGSAEPMSPNSATRAWDYLATPQGLGRDNDPPTSPVYSLGETGGYLHQPRPQQPPAQFSHRSVDDFGVNNPVASGTTGAAAAGGRFATFPVKNNRGGAGIVLHDNPVPRPENEQPFASPVAPSLSDSFSSDPQIPGPNDYSAPSYEIPHSPTYAPPPRLPPGAGLANPWSDPGAHDNRLSSISDAEAELAYMSEPIQGPALADRMNDGDDGIDHGNDMHVHFGRVSDVDEEMRGRQSTNRGISISHDLPDPPPSDVSPPRQSVPPSFAPDDERALNAAAAREVTRELDALTFNPPSPSMARAPASPLVFGQSAPSSERAPSPLAPPAPPFAKRATSPIPDSSPYLQSGSQVSSWPTKSDSPLSSSLAVNLQGSPVSNNNSPYRTPPEYPRGPGFPAGAPPVDLSSSSLSAPITPGTRTISAAAFKRPQPRLVSLDALGGGVADTSPLAFKKRLPSSPYPRAAAPPSPVLLGDSSSLGRAQRERALPVARNSHLEDDDQFDYISAYVNSMPSEEEMNGQGSGPDGPGASRAAGHPF